VSRRPRHCMVVHAYYPLMETRVEREAGMLLERGYEVDVICLRLPDELAHEVVDGVNVYRASVSRRPGRGVGAQLVEYVRFFAAATAMLVRLYARRRYDVIQVHNLPDFLVFCALVPKLLGARVILDIHDVMPEFLSARSGRAMDSPLVRLTAIQERMSAAFADHVVTVTEVWRTTLASRGVPYAKSSVVMNLADPRFFVPCGDVAAADDGALRLLYHGTLTPRYGLDVALRALAELRDESPPVRLLIHGQGDDLERLTTLVDELGLGDTVRIETDVLPVEALGRLVCGADVGLVPYRRDVFTDGILPTKLMEYLAAERPVIAARTPAIEAHVTDRMVEFFAAEDPHDLARAIRRLRDDPERRAELAREARTFGARYGWAAQAAAYVATVDRLRGARPVEIADAT
jgi:glycosyltransferase involved in cell wall biosynthesis